MKLKKIHIKIHAAAFYFVNTSRDLHEIANVFDVTEFAVRKWAKTPQWAQALDALGYTGDRDFITKPTRDTVRDAGEIFDKARKVYLEALTAGTPKHKLARITADELGLTPKRVRTWAQKYDWREQIHTHDKTGGIDA